MLRLPSQCLSYFILIKGKSLKQIDSGPAGIVWGVNKDDDIYCRDGIKNENPKGTDWKHISGKLKYVSCGPYGCWGVNSLDNIYFRRGVTAAECSGTGWVRVSGLLRQLEVSAYIITKYEL